MPVTGGVAAGAARWVGTSVAGVVVAPDEVRGQIGVDDGHLAGRPEAVQLVDDLVGDVADLALVVGPDRVQHGQLDAAVLVLDSVDVRHAGEVGLVVLVLRQLIAVVDVDGDDGGDVVPVLAHDLGHHDERAPVARPEPVDERRLVLDRVALQGDLVRDDVVLDRVLRAGGDVELSELLDDRAELGDLRVVPGLHQDGRGGGAVGLAERDELDRSVLQSTGLGGSESGHWKAFQLVQSHPTLG